MNASELEALNSDAINPERNKVTNLTASFFRGEDGKDYCEIRNNHNQSGDTVIQVVDPSHVRRWPRLWDAYQHGRERNEPVGTPLKEVPGVDNAMILVYRLRGIHTAEMLAAANDITLNAIDEKNGKTVRRNAQLLLRAQEADRLEGLLAERTKPEDEALTSQAAQAAHAERLRDLKAKQDARKQA